METLFILASLALNVYLLAKVRGVSEDIDCIKSGRAKIQMKRSGEEGKVPEFLHPGELAVNTADGVIWLRRDDGEMRYTLMMGR